VSRAVVGNAMVTVEVQLPDEILAALRRSPDEMAGELRLAAAVHWYSRGLISPGTRGAGSWA
jgi:hypothetical protein